MTGRNADTEGSDSRTSRRRFVKLLAGSPLLALVYPALPPDWQRLVAREAQRRASALPQPAGVLCPDCGQEMVYLRPVKGHGHPAQSPVQSASAAAGDDAQDINRFLKGQFGGNVIESPDQAVNVWDMEQTLHASNLPEHWAYLHMGVDDLETRRANREGFLRLAIRPRRLGQDATKLDTSVQLFGRKWNTPLFLSPVAALEAYHTEGESGAARAARAKGILQIQSNVSSQSYKTIAEARGEPHWFQIYTVPDWNMNKRVIDRVARAGCPGADLDGRPARREQSGTGKTVARSRRVQQAGLPELPQSQARLPEADARRHGRPPRTACAVHVGLREAPQGRHDDEGPSEGDRHA